MVGSVAILDEYGFSNAKCEKGLVLKSPSFSTLTVMVSPAVVHVCM